VKIPVQEHVPWARKTLPIPPGIHEKVIELIWKKIDSGVYEPSYSSYCHQWFTVAKKDGNVRIVHNLTPLNAVTIRDTQEPPLVYLYAEQCSTCSIYLGLDLFVGKFLDTLKMPKELATKTKQQFLQYASKFFVQGDKLWQ